MRLRLTNTRTKALEEIVPHAPDGILRMYHCGPTVYSTPHLGNLRRFLFADLLVRTARLLDYRVRSVMNITDVGHLLDPTPLAAGARRGAGPTAHRGRDDTGQDRMLVAAEREGLSPERIAAKYTAEFFAALAALRAEPADYFPRATMHIPQMQNIIRRLLERGLAYETAAGVYFAVTQFPNYGALSGNSLAAIQAGARVDAREEKRHSADFVLWVKAPETHQMQWDSPWGRGYPGWHIECSAMSMQLLGETVDIHSGGADNIFPHHENEIAQSEGATGIPFVRTWVHNEFLEFGEGKMSKSEGGTLTLADVTRHGADPLAFRLLCLQTHYRSKLHFSWEAMDAAATALAALRSFTARLSEEVGQTGARDAPARLGDRLSSLEDAVVSALADDLGTPQALAAVFAFTREINPALQQGLIGGAALEAIRSTLRKLDSVFAVLNVNVPVPSENVPPDVRDLVDRRESARRAQDFTAADQLRAALRAKGYAVEDTPRGPRLRLITAAVA